MIPNSEIWIINGVPITSDYEHSLWFASRDEQINYYKNHSHVHITSMSYARTGANSLKVEVPLSSIVNANYLMFINPNYENRYFFAFINKVEYISDTTTQIIYTMDWLQSYITSLQFGQCFVEREHVIYDYNNFCPEGLETGDYITYQFYEDFANMMSQGYAICVNMAPPFGRTIWIDGERIDFRSNFAELYDDSQIGKIANVPDSLLHIYFTTSDEGLRNFYGFLGTLGEANLLDSIASITLIPKGIFNNFPSDKEWYISGKDTSEIRYNVSIPYNRTLLFNGWIAKNEKLYSFPYLYLELSNNEGEKTTFKIEDLHVIGGHIEFTVRGSVSSSGDFVVYPKNSYQSSSTNMIAWDDRLGLKIGQIIPFSNDVYKAWLVNNKATNDLALSKGAASVGTGALMLGASSVNPALAMQGASMLISGAEGVFNALNQREVAKMQPNTAKGTSTPSASVGASMTKFSCSIKGVRPAVANRIDEYFTTYGYRVNDNKTPSLHNRTRFTYVKTRGCIIKSDLPTVARDKICAIMNKGCTFWVGHANGTDSVGDYSSDNAPLN